MGEFFLGIMEITIGMSILILLMLFTLKLIGGKFTAKCRYILWTLVMIRLAVPVSFGILPALIEVPVETEPVQQIQMQVPTVNYTPTQQNPITVQPQEQVQIPTPTVQTPVFTEPEPDPLTWEDVKAYIPHAYLAGAAVFLLWNLLAYGIYTAKILRSARESDAETQAIYDALCLKKGLHRMPKLLVSPAVNSPAAFGLLFRRIVLPDIALTENGLTGTLSHEVTHCKRGDLWIKAICLLARSFHWFNPLVHLAAFRCEMEMELSCDEAVLSGCDENTRAAYGEVMLDIIKRCRRNRGALTTHFNPGKNAVKARFTNILYGSGKRRGLWLIAVCLVLCLIAGAIVACRTEEDDIQETLTEPLPDGETVEIPLIYKQYTPELSQDMFVEEIQETELTEILQDQELCGVRVILYLDENELFCAAYERDDTLFRFIRTGGVEPVSYAAEEFSDVLEADGFTVSWSWSHRFRAYFTVEDGAPALYLDAYDNVTEADYDNDGVTEVICQNMTNVDIYDISDGTLQTVAFDSELIQPKPGEFYRYLPEKNWFEFDYKKGGEDTLFHRYGTVQDGMLTLVTPDESLSENSETGEFPTIEAYVTDRMAKETTAQYFAAEPDGNSISSQQKTANVTDTKLTVLEKKGELAGLAPNGILECWRYKYFLKLDVPTEEVILVGGQDREDDWFDLEGQNGHTVVALRHPDGTYTILMDEMTGDGLDFHGYRNSYEEAIYDWYVTEYALGLPLCVEEWGDLITPPEGERIGNTPVHRFDGDGWGIYIHVQAWYQSTDAMENQWLWRSSYNTGSTLMVDEFSHSLEDEYVTAEKQGYIPADSTKRVWEKHTDGLHSCYYYYENPSGGFWRVTIEWTDEGITDYPYIAIEPQVLRLMAEKFVVFGTGNPADNAVTVTSPIYLCDDVYRGDITPTHGESTITFPDGLDGYKLYTCEVLLCDDGCDPYNVVCRNYFGYAGGFPLQEMKITKNGSYTTGLWLFTYPNEILEQILSDMEKGGASEEEKQSYRNKRAYLYHLTIDEQHCACIFIEPEDVLAVPENEQEILDALIASCEITVRKDAPEDNPNHGDVSLRDFIEDNKAAITEEIYSIIREAEKVRYDIREPELEIVSITEDRADCIFWSDWEWSRKAEEDPMILGMYEAMEALTDAQEIEYANDIIQGWIPEIESWYITERIEQRIVIKQNNGSWTLHYPHIENGEETLFDLAEYAAEHWTEDSEARKQGGADIINDAIKLYREMEKTVSTVNPDTIWQTFLDTVVSPYSEYISSHEFLDLDGNGIDELILYDYGMGVGEIFTIENGEVRSFYTGEHILTHYSDDRKALAPPSLGAGEYVFYASRTPTDESKAWAKNWFVPSPAAGGYVLYSTYGHTTSRTDQYFHFYSGEDAVLGKFLCVEELKRFDRDAVNSNPEQGWICYVNGQEVSNSQYIAQTKAAWADILTRYGVEYTDENTLAELARIEKAPNIIEEILLPEEEIPDGIVDEDSEPYTYTREEWIQYSLYTDFGFRDPVEVSALTDEELTAYMADAYQCALDIYFLFHVSSDRMYARNVWSSDMPHVEIDGRCYSRMFNPVFPTLADLESYMNGVLSHDLTRQLLEMGMFIDYEGELWGMMGARGTDISKKTVGFSVTSRTDTEIIYTAEVEVREHDLGAEKPDYVEYHDFTYALTEHGWRWTDFYLYN